MAAIWSPHSLVDLGGDDAAELAIGEARVRARPAESRRQHSRAVTRKRNPPRLRRGSSRVEDLFDDGP